MKLSSKIIFFLVLILVCFGFYQVFILMRVDDPSITTNDSKAYKNSLGNDSSKVQSSESTPEALQSDEEESSDCPLEGSTRMVNLQQLNRLKNRSEIPTDDKINQNINLARLIEPGNDQDRWQNNAAALVTGYVADVKIGGIETCNCKAREADKRDTHIELVLNPMNFINNQKVIVEVTPRMRKKMAAMGVDWSTRTIRDKFLGRWVKVKGWMLFDFEHARQAENTNAGNPKNWRATSWEIHPITSIEVTQR